MSATLEETARVYHCLICGPLMRFPYGDGYVTFHRDVPHPHDLTFDEEDNPQ